jgi:hypothetical protein
MTTWCEPDKLDLGRGVRLARDAYTIKKPGVVVPIIEAGHFERDGEVLQRYSAKEMSAF